VQLYITPQVIGSNSAKLHVVTTVSAVAGFSELSSMTQKERGQGLVNPVVQAREAETFVDVEDGATLVIGGLRMIRTITRERKMPLFGDVPLMEWFFKSHRSQNNVNDLYFFVTPRLVHSNRPKARPKAVALRLPAPSSVAPKPALPVQPVGPPAAPKGAAPAKAAPAKPAATQPAPPPKPAPAKLAATQPAPKAKPKLVATASKPPAK
jgi:pilus assembly protein CpaC